LELRQVLGGGRGPEPQRHHQVERLGGDDHDRGQGQQSTEAEPQQGERRVEHGARTDHAQLAQRVAVERRGRVIGRVARSAAPRALGPGVAAGDRAKIFDPFFTRKQGEGTGLGLAISKRIAEEAGGTLTVEPSPLGGAMFRLRLPLAKR